MAPKGSVSALLAWKMQRCSVELTPLVFFIFMWLMEWLVTLWLASYQSLHDQRADDNGSTAKKERCSCSVPNASRCQGHLLNDITSVFQWGKPLTSPIHCCWTSKNLETQEERSH